MPLVEGVDCHAHVFHRGLALAAERRYEPVGDAPLAAYLALLDRLGMANGVLVQPSFLGSNNAYLLDCIARSAGRLRGVAVVPLGMSADGLKALASMGISGVRFNLIGTPLPNFAAPVWQLHLRRIADAGLHAEVQCRGRAIESILPLLLDALPRVVLDHFGLPESADPDEPAARAILALARVRQLFIKLSAPYRFLATDTDVGPLVAAYVDAFGPDRLLWGSDWPHTQFELRGDAACQLAALGRQIGTMSPVYQAIVSGTARTLYGFAAPSRYLALAQPATD